ncbi:MAG: hypothetical protein HW384_934 [Dehalococcoidia bacterium]|nr:hypothetical protein [Dehalococcoidia bacterium]
MVNTEIFEYNPHSSRLKGYDYTQPGAYFVTICTYARMCFFGEIKEGKMFLNKYGDIVHSCWHAIPHHFPDVKRSSFVVMPNHVHGIIIISKLLPPSVPCVETRHVEDPRFIGAVSETKVSQNTNEEFQKPVPNSLPTIIRSFKSAVTKRLNELGENLPVTVWQRNYYEHVIRDKKELNRKIQYINSNPVKWEMDEDNPINTKKTGTNR